jgi:hypothetical protein
MAYTGYYQFFVNIESGAVRIKDFHCSSSHGERGTPVSGNLESVL